MKNTIKKDVIHCIDSEKIEIISREQYIEEIKKMLPKLETLEAVKSVYEMVVLCISNKQK